MSSSTLSESGTATATPDSIGSPQDKKPLGMSIVVPQADEPTLGIGEPPVTPPEIARKSRHQSLGILEELGYSERKPKIAKTPWTPGASEGTRQDASLPTTPQTPYKKGDRKASLMHSESLTSSPVSPGFMSRLSWTASRMRGQTEDHPNTLDSAQDNRNAEMFRRFGRRPSLLFPIRENPSTVSRTAPSTPQQLVQPSTMRDVESPPSPTPAPRATPRPATASGPRPSLSTYHGRGQVPAYWEPFWSFKDKPQPKGEDGSQ